MYKDVELPVYATKGAACFDIRAYLPFQNGRSTVIAPYSVIPTGLQFEIPEGKVLMVYSRSGHGFKHATRLANCVGVIDSDYRGELMVRLARDTSLEESLVVNHGDRIAQAMLVDAEQVTFEEIQEISETARGKGGMGSTGK